MAVLKGNAYGHGLLICARALGDADSFGVIELDGAIALREAGLRQPIVLLEGLYEADEIEQYRHYRLTSVIHCQDQIDMLATATPGKPIDVFLKVNSGMNRLGIPTAQVAAKLGTLHQIKAVGSIKLMTHFACADGAAGIQFQLDRLKEIPRRDAYAWSMANSAALLRYPVSHCDIVRPGLMLFGGSPFDDASASALALQPVMTLKTKLIGIQELSVGEIVGYAGIFTAETRMRIGVTAGGFGDGYPRHASLTTPVLVDGHRTRTVGRISMDKVCIDLTGVPSATVGSEVIFWGPGLPANEVAAAVGTNAHQLMSAPTARVTRIATNVGEAMSSVALQAELLREPIAAAV
jgi:alanine racemase